MTNSSRVLPLLLVAASAAAPALAAESFDVVRLDPPSGFRMDRGEDHLGFTRVDESAKTFCQIALYASRPAANPLAQEFAVEWQQVALGAASTDIPAMATGKTKNGIELASGEQTVKKSGQTFRSRLYALQADHAVFSLLVNASNEDALKKCMPAVDGMLASLVLAKPAAPAAANAPAAKATVAPISASAPASGALTTTDVPHGKGIAGVWMGMEMPMGGAPYERYASFYDDGIWYADIPRYGYAGFRRDEARNDAGTGSYWGTWKLTGSEGELTRPSVTRKMPLKILKDDEIELDHTHYYRCASVDGMKLDGAWTSYANPADPDLKKPGGTKAILHFSPDGHFRDDGLFALFLGSMDGPVKSAPGSGTYEIKDWTLILRYDDGHVRTAAFSMFVRGKADPKASSIYVQRTRLNRVP